MHDAVAGELAGIPSVGVMTERFVSAAELMTQVLGAVGHQFVVMEHPISSASAEQLADRASVAAAHCAAVLLG